MAAKHPDFSCIILAGGKGSRMHGDDKGLVKFGGKPLIEHVLDIVRPQTADIVVSANRNLSLYKGYGYPVIQDTIDGFLGPLAGIASALPACKHDWILVVPCDMPCLPDDIAMQLYLQHDNNRLVAVEAGGRQQLVFLLHRCLRDSIIAFISAGHSRIMSWLQSEAHGLVIYDAHGPAFCNINSHEDLDQAG